MEKRSEIQTNKCLDEFVRKAVIAELEALVSKIRSMPKFHMAKYYAAQEIAITIDNRIKELESVGVKTIEAKGGGD